MRELSKDFVYIAMFAVLTSALVTVYYNYRSRERREIVPVAYQSYYW